MAQWITHRRLPHQEFIPHPTVSNMQGLELGQAFPFQFEPQPSPAGIRFEPRDLSGQLGAWVATPGFLKDEMDRINGEIRSVGRDIQAVWERTCEPLPEPFVRDESACGQLNRFIQGSWSPFVIEWDQFRARHANFFSRLWGNLWDQLQEYRKRLLALRQTAVGLNIEIIGPTPALPPDPDFTQLGGGLFGLLKTIAYVGLTVGVIWVGFRIYKDIRG